MKTISRLFQTYIQAPWRTQLQWIGIFLTGLAILIIISAFYVNVTTRTALAGREIALAKDNILRMHHDISDLESTIASQGSTKNMQERAEILGFKPVGPEEFTFIYVPGYTQKTAFSLAPKAVRNAEPILLPEYTESLFDWFANRGQP
ncbi:MAG: hypothetical protein A2X25_03310 [Chloroflexi bacterium GWB2_49_20]|nr:MAG: hypothetical protein A2X25_03310 [Chloroflexi bacterium GWB2_49_20]OGN76126.1 MAG: hypothetical protein A2X26_11585 [Chloroflexi bacterium GWC2_49_37]OGN83512.1 MAG: hypothetical protein A2X27_09420 [Chloroflexi bacterium GWD2_49_16]HBG73913.1 hypothetical protein [Anaerolineae bacterium]HCC79507.1 hypothetical protein [Anaerolineae bacterium]